MKRIGILLATLVALYATPAAGQTPPAPPTPPGAPVPAQAPTPRPDPNIRRHRMEPSGHKIDTDAQVQAALKAQIDALRQQMAKLEAEAERTGDPKTREELERLREQIEALDTLTVLDGATVPDVVPLDPDHPGVLLPNMDGVRPLIIDPEDRTPNKSRGEKMAYFRPLYINHDDWIDGPAIAILGNVYVEGHVEEDVISVGGNVYVEGSVSGNVVAPFGDVYIGSHADVEGDVVGVSVTTEDEAAIGGKIEELPLFRLPGIEEGPQALLVLAGTAATAKIIFSLLFGWLTLALAPNHTKRVTERLRQRPLASFFGGLLVQLLILPVFVLLLVTVVGIPLAILALPFIVLVGLLLGFVACSRIVGESLLGRDGSRPAVVQFFVGALVLCAPLGLASILALSGAELVDTLFMIVCLTFFVGLCLLYIVYTAGLGAAIFSRLGTRTVGPRKVASQPAGPLGIEPARTALPQAPPAADLTSS